MISFLGNASARKWLIMVAFLFLSPFSVSHDGGWKDDMREYYRHQQDILNTIINSKDFDNLIDGEKFSFKENEILSGDENVLLKKAGCKVDIEAAPKGLYIILGDLFIGGKDPVVRARVQLEIPGRELLVNVALQYVAGSDSWAITYFGSM